MSALTQEPDRITVSQLAVSRLQGRLSARTQGLDHSHAKALAQCPDLLPPIVVHESSLRVIDGLHRVRAAQIRGQDEIAVAIFDGGEEEAFALSALLNTRHGLPLALEERKESAARILLNNPEWSDRFVASFVGLSPKVVANIRQRSTSDSRQLNRRIGRDGKARPVDPVSGRLRAAALLTQTPGLSLRQLARAADISVSTARDVRIRLDNGDDPVPERLRGALDGRDGGGADVLSPGGEMPTPGEHGEAGSDERPPTVSMDIPWGDELRAERKAVSFDVVLERLKRDPAVRFNEAGRHLIRQLLAAQAAVTNCRQVLPFVPTHSLGTVADLAVTQAQAWQQLAELADATVETTQAQ
ncbi:hypothetical protein BST19_20425 [Mycobacterium bouchedurhonense]|uniref:ParB-like N-terminal domain-containing protein n=1 Tax=Mycobacterium bouchedurhonense TaxID=701041 RepID=A0ABX3SAF3_MYCBC|nr:hypothetical protein BST19_20425 [Mycobacterium bouchedurhonense]